MLDRPVTIRLDHLATALRGAGLGEPPPVLGELAVWRDAEAARAANRSAWEAFERADLVEGGGLRPAVFRALSVLAAPMVEYYGWFTARGRSSAVLVAADGEDAVLAVRSASTVRLSAADAEGLPEALVATIPRARPAQGRSITLPLATFRAELGTRPAEPSPVTTIGAVGDLDPVAEDATQDLTVLAQLVQPGLGGFGELYSAARTNRTRHRCVVPHPVRYADTETGRWLVRVVPSPAEDWVSVAPADRQTMITSLREAHHTLID